MRIEVCTDRRALASLATEWNSLLERSSADSLFMTWEWVSAWLTSQPDELEFIVIVVRNDSKALVGIAPFFVRRFSLFRLIPVRVLCAVGSTDSGAEYPGVIVDSSVQDEVVECIAGSLLDAKKAWDLIWLPNISAWTDAIADITDVLDAGALSHRTRQREFSSIALGRSFEDYLHSQTAQRRQRIRKYVRERESGAGFRFSLIEQPADLESAVSSLIDLHSRRWRSRLRLGSFEKRPPLVDFYRSFTAVANQKGWLRLYQLRKGEILLATQIGYIYKHVFYQLQEAFDPDIDAGVGNILRAYVLEQCIDEGVIEYDFLGGVTEHKRRWGATKRNGADLIAASPSRLGRLIVNLRIWPTGRYLRPSL